jgi:hypothetical protein
MRDSAAPDANWLPANMVRHPIWMAAILVAMIAAGSAAASVWQTYARYPLPRYPIPAAKLKFLPRYRQIVEMP